MTNKPWVHWMSLVVFAVAGGFGCDGSNPGKTAETVVTESDGAAPGSQGCQCPKSGEPDPLGSPFPVARQDLSCWCDRSPAACGVTLSTYDAAGKCQAGQASSASLFGMIRRTGCGKITYQYSYSLGGPAETFDAVSGTLVGHEDTSDAPGECGVHDHIYGDTNETCADVQVCLVCGNFNWEKAPPC